MYFHPAKFIPQVISWFIKEYTNQGQWIIDPFAGSGTLAVECLITNRNALCLDLNPVMEHIVRAKTFRTIDSSFLYKAISSITSSTRSYNPCWSRVNYWYHPEVMVILQRMWAAYYDQPHPLVLLALFKTSRRFSYADDAVPKIFISKTKRREIDNLVLNTRLKTIIHDHFVKSVKQVYESSLSFTSFYSGGEVVALGGLDLPNYHLNRTLDHLITSPPYGRAHEYIRTFKLELAWLGYDDSGITNLTGKEIPYRSLSPDINSFEVLSPTYNDFRNKLEPKLLRDYDCYFKSVIKALENIMFRVNKYSAIFVGNATYGGIEPPYAQIFVEHFENKGFTHIRTLLDQIVARKLFLGRKNLSPSGIKEESLVILKSP